MTRPSGWNTRDPFFDSREWQNLRYAVLEASKGHCSCCGNRGDPDNPLQVDHIKPRSIYPELALDISNLQVLCRDCNLGKGNRYETDWRTDLPGYPFHEMDLEKKNALVYQARFKLRESRNFLSKVKN